MFSVIASVRHTSGGAEPGGAGTWGAEPGGTEPGGAEPGGVEPGGAATEGAPPGGALSRREPLSPQELREWFARRWRRAASTGGSSAAEGAAATGPGAGPAEGAGAEPTTGGPASAAPGAPGTHRMSLRPSTAPLRAPLPSSPASSLPALADAESDSLRAASPTVARLLATAVTDPSFESSAASALVTELVDFAARCRLDYATSLVAESESTCSPSVRGECALGTDVLEDRQEEFQCLAAASPHLASVLLAPEGDPDALDIRGACLPLVHLRLQARCPGGAKVSGSNPSVCTSGIPVRGGVRGPLVIFD
ncbi:unnamed protein product [Closterium sp. NIES-54]